MHCLLEGRDVFAGMPTTCSFGMSFIFPLFSTAIEQKKIWEREYPNSVILVNSICLLISLIEDQIIKEGQTLGLMFASLQDVISDNPLSQLLQACISREGTRQ